MDVLQEFECLITEVSDGNVWIHAIDLTDRERPDEMMAIDVSDFEEDHRQYLIPGVVFLWVLSHGRYSSSGTSRFIFSGERWTREALNRVKMQARCQWEAMVG